MWNVPHELISVCETDGVGTVPVAPEVVRTLYTYTGGRGAWIGRALRIFPPSHPQFARDENGKVWSFVSSEDVASEGQVIDVTTMLKGYVYEEYRQRAEDDRRYREKCVDDVYVPSPELHPYSSDEDGPYQTIPH